MDIDSRAGMTGRGRTTRRQLLVRTGTYALPLMLATRPAFAAARSETALPSGNLVANAAETAQVRANIFELRLPFAVGAWQNTLERADNWLGYQPAPPRDDVPITNWNEQLYGPGLRDGNAAYNLGLAFAIAGKDEHGGRARDICLAWARTYRRSRPQNEIGHMVAEPVGPVIKLCMAFQLALPAFDLAQRAEFRAWAAQFVAKGKRNADSTLDSPWVPDVVYGNDRTNVAAYGNSATWQRAMAVWAAAAVGGATLRSTLDWSFEHTTGGGRPYGWDELLEGLIIDGSGGQVAEDRYRNSIEYGMFSWAPLVLIADVARRAKYRVNLFTYASRRNRYTLLTPLPYYRPFLTSESISPSLEQTAYGSDWSKTASRWRSFWEVVYRNVSEPKAVKLLRQVVNYGGPERRADNYDIYIVNNGAVLGRGPRGPMPAVPPTKRPKPRPKTPTRR